MTLKFGGKRCLVTGGAGFIGSHLVSELVNRKARVTVLDDLSTGRSRNVSKRARLVTGDVRDRATVLRSVRRQDYLFHLAAQVGNVLSIKDPLSNMQINVGGSIQLFEAARRARVSRIIYASSSAALGEATMLPQDEMHPCKPLSPYGVSKLSAEQYGLSLHNVHGLPFVSLRFFNVYGPRQGKSEYGNVIPIFFDKLLRGNQLSIFGDGQQTRDFTYVDDVVQAILRAASSPRATGEVFHIGTGKATTIVALARTMQKVVGRDTGLVRKPPRSGEVRDSVADIRKAQSLLGYDPRYSLETGLRLTLASLKATS